MNYRINTRIIILVAALVVVAIGLFTYTLVSAPSSDELPIVNEQKPEDAVPERIISARHQYVDGIHTVAGKAQVPTPCHRLIADPFLLENNTVVEVRFSTFLEGAECPASPMDAPFRVTFEAAENVTMQATWDGAPARLNLVPLGPGETLDDELYFKG